MSRVSNLTVKPTSLISDFKEITKMRLSLSVVFSSIAGYLLGADVVSVYHILLLSLGGYFMVGASNAFNQIIERDTKAAIDSIFNSSEGVSILPNVMVSLLNNKGKKIDSIISNEKGEYNFTIDCLTSFALLAEKINYVSEEFNVKSTEQNADTIYVDFTLKEKDILFNGNEHVLNIDPFYYDFDKADISTHSVVGVLTIVDILIGKLLAASDKFKINELAIAGGVSANSLLREKLNELEKKGYNTFIPDFQYCLDNAGMVAMTAYFQYLKKDFASLDFEPKARWPMV